MKRVRYFSIFLFVCCLLSITVSAQPEPEVPVFDLTGTGAEDPLIVATNNTYLKSSVPNVNAAFGRSVAVSGNTVVVGETGDDSIAVSSGAAYVYEQINGAWVQVAKLKAPNPTFGAFFGVHVAISGDTIVVANPDEDNVYVYVRSSVTWVYQATLRGSNITHNDRFGQSVAIDGNTIVVGAPGEDSAGSDPDDNSASASGAAYVFVRTGTSWMQNDMLKAPNAEETDQFGQAVDVEGDHILVSAPFEDSSGNPFVNDEESAGAVYAFERRSSGNGWIFRDFLKADYPSSLDGFGYKVAIADNTALISTVGENWGTNGKAYFFERSGWEWSQTQTVAPLASTVDEVNMENWSVALSGDTAVIGTLYDDTAATDGGAAYVYLRVNGTWVQNLRVTSGNTTAGDHFAWSVALDGQILVVGIPDEDSDGSAPNNNSVTDSGAARIYTLVPEFRGIPAPPGPLVMEGDAGAPASVTFAVRNRSTNGFLLNVNVQSITSGYTVNSGLPVFGLSHDDPDVIVEIQCDNPGTTPQNGTLVLETNEIGLPTYTYDLMCNALPTPTPTPTSTPTPTPTFTPTATVKPPEGGRIAPADGAVIDMAAEYVTKYQWYAIDGAAWYHVFVLTGDYTQILFDEWYPASAVCNGTICTMPDDLWLLNNGSYSWWMTYWNETVGANFLNLYAESRFTLNLPVPSGVTGVPGDPVSNPTTFQWNPDPATIFYQVLIVPADYTDVNLLTWFGEADSCANGVCSISPFLSLAPGDYELWIQGWNPGGYGSWQKLTAFTVAP